MEKFRNFLRIQRRILRPLRVFFWVIFLGFSIWNSKTLFGQYSLQSVLAEKLEQLEQEFKTNYPEAKLIEEEKIDQVAKSQIRREQMRDQAKMIFKIGVFAFGALLMYFMVISPMLESIWINWVPGPVSCRAPTKRSQ